MKSDESVTSSQQLKSILCMGHSYNPIKFVKIQTLSMNVCASVSMSSFKYDVEK